MFFRFRSKGLTRFGNGVFGAYLKPGLENFAALVDFRCWGLSGLIPTTAVPSADYFMCPPLKKNLPKEGDKNQDLSPCYLPTDDLFPSSDVQREMILTEIHANKKIVI